LVTVAGVSDGRAYGPLMQGPGFVLRVRQPGHRMFRHLL
jgi:hypothetical protein